MNNDVLHFLESHKSATPSKFQERARWRKDNAGWLKWSRKVASALVDYMQSNDLKRADLAEKLDVTPQYVGRLLSGKENLSFKSLSYIEEKLNLELFEMSMA